MIRSNAINSREKRTDIASTRISEHSYLPNAPRIGLISLGCPKALVDSERILTELKNEGYSISKNFKEADAVIVNTCGFLDTAKAESLETIREALKENGKVIVTGCLGVRSNEIKEKFPSLLSISGPQQFQKVVDAVHQAIPPIENKFHKLIPSSTVKLTPRHYYNVKHVTSLNIKSS